jgi:hypothetical protein
MKKISLIFLLFVIGIISAQSIFVNKAAKVAFPEDYRNWTHVKSVVIMEGHDNYKAFGGIHHIYANDKANAALKEGKSFAKGAVLVFDLLEEKIENNAVIEGSRKVVGVMEKDPDRFAETEGWGFEDFLKGDPNQRLVTDMREQCLSCHKTQKAFDYVYSKYRK